jgi:protein O-GlcNAc transferase
LAAVRENLRSQMEASALRDELGFARNVEAAYREMFAIWAAGSAEPR